MLLTFIISSDFKFNIILSKISPIENTLDFSKLIYVQSISFYIFSKISGAK